MNSTVSLAGRKIGAGEPVFIVAEGGVNHNGDLNIALQLVEAAADAGADAIKFQTWHTELVISRSAPLADYQRRTTSETQSQYDMVARLELEPDAFRCLQRRAASRGLVFFSTPFDLPSVDLLVDLNVPLFKIPSGEINHFPLLEKVARTGRPAIVSTGMCSLGEVEAAVNCLQGAGARELVLLHCLSSYPAPMEEINLRAMQTLAYAFHMPVGLSDHTLGDGAAIAAVSLGAAVIEKHLTISRDLAGPDHQASLDPSGFRDFVSTIRLLELALGDGVKRLQPSERNVRSVARRSIVAARDLAAGTRLADDDLCMKRPGTGLESQHLHEVIGRITCRDLPTDSMLSWSDLLPA